MCEMRLSGGLRGLGRAAVLGSVFLILGLASGLLGAGSAFGQSSGGGLEEACRGYAMLFADERSGGAERGSEAWKRFAVPAVQECRKRGGPNRMPPLEGDGALGPAQEGPDDGTKPDDGGTGGGSGGDTGGGDTGGGDSAGGGGLNACWAYGYGRAVLESRSANHL